MARTDESGPETRVAVIERILRSHCGTDSVNPEQDVADILADLRHYCDAHGLAYHELDRKAHGFYVAEVYGRAA